MRKIVSDCIVVFAFASFLAFLKPFGMHNVGYFYALSFWLVMCFSGYVLYAPAIRVGDKALASVISERWRKWISVGVSTAVASVLLGLIAPFIVDFFFSLQQSYWSSVASSTVASLFIGGFITLISIIKDYVKAQHQIITEQQQKIIDGRSQAASMQARPAIEFMGKLPIDKRGKLLCLQMDDHYLRVITDNGEHLLLMRFKDALQLLDTFPGFQTHRSWWVAKDAVSATKKTGRKLILVLENGDEVPVSQTYLTSTKHALDLH
ncbi:LytTR family transcriptional regulator [Pseudoalteromonas sp. SMS1]|uniref:LytTR family DNA-binding domain-containing protein n=1 Tax=Pseudoalteromonas sp. SMS1 TaxID=2908894 RepID=UPI001F1BC70E|nr:LytTR family DNA-binding domain-containing protein [Pseudoalteromonas sp. SMS1]MCF2860466.1 LytTR family transcriptional regulator [Pseudoalteromonas sp. SMS1]